MTSHAVPLYRAVARSMLGRYFVYAANLLSMMLLARLFTPETFGSVAAIAVFYIFFQLIAEVGLGPAIINLGQLAQEDRDGLFGLTVLAGLILGAIFYALAPAFSAFYQVERVDEVVPFVALSLAFYAASVVPSALLQRDQAFFRIAHAGAVAELVSTVAVVMLARIIDPLHALAAKASFSAASSFAMQQYFTGQTEIGRPALGRKFNAIKPMLGFSGHQFGFNFINYFSRNLDNILIGKYMGSTTLGVYDKAYQLMRYPLMLLTFAMTPAIQPVIRKHAGDSVMVETIHRSFTFKLSLIGAAVGLCVHLFAGQIVNIALGSQWAAVIPIIQILAIAIPVQIVLSTSGSFFQAMGRPDLLFFSGALSAIAMVAAIVWGIYRRDVLALSWGLVIAFHINFFQAYYCMYVRVFKTRMWAFFVQKIPAAIIVFWMARHSS